MEPSPKTNCTRCGTGILQITADLNGGHCMPCAYALERESRPSFEPLRKRNHEPLLNHLHPAGDVILSVDYDPGWSPDLTSWVIQISGDGFLHQAICWDRKRGGEAELLKPVPLDRADLAGLQQLVETFTPESFRALAKAVGVDDAAMVSVVMPAQGVRESLPYFHLEFHLKKGPWKLDETQSASFQLFRQLWRFADRHAPYSLRDHQKSNR